jgi:hypothetical protein
MTRLGVRPLPVLEPVDAIAQANANLRLQEQERICPQGLEDLITTLAVPTGNLPARLQTCLAVKQTARTAIAAIQQRAQLAK